MVELILGNLNFAYFYYLFFKNILLICRFEIVSDTALDQPIVGSSPDECHTRLLAAISPSLSTIPAKGSDFFGISLPTIQNLIQSSPGTRKLAMYKPLKFEVSPF